MEKIETLEITTIDNYTTNEIKLENIKVELEGISEVKEGSNIDLARVVLLRDNARVIASALKSFISKTFEKEK